MGCCMSKSKLEVISCPRKLPPVSGSTLTLEEVTNRQHASVSESALSKEEVTNRQHASVSESAPSKEEVIKSLKDVSDTTDLKGFVRIIKQLVEEKKSAKGTECAKEKESPSKDKKGMWNSFITSGDKFLKFVNEHTHGEDILSSGNSKIVADILGQIGKLHWAVGVLAIAAYLVEKIEKVSANKENALELLTNIVDLATTVVKVMDMLTEEEERLNNAVQLIVQGSIMCVAQIHSEKISSFLRTSINSENLKKMSDRVGHLYRDLTLVITTKIANRQPILLPVPKPEYPKDAVGIEIAQKEVIKLLNITSQDESTLLVVIYGFGGIGKTTLATSVVAMLNLNSYNYASIELDEDKLKNDLERLQELILIDACPSSHYESKIEFRNCREGRQCLKKGFRTETKPIFLFIDNALRSEDLKELLPEDLSDMPKHSRIFLTTRKLDITDGFKIKRESFAMKTLQDDHAIKILCKDDGNRELIKDDLRRILRICDGIPLALRLVSGHLVKMKYNAGKCSQILYALENGAHVKEENLSGRLFDYVYNELEDGTKEAFLDICCFFNGWIRRHVEYIVGAQEVQSLAEAAFVTPLMDEDVWEIYAGEERLIVHDIIRAKGRAMSEFSRFMDVESFFAVAQDETKLNGIRGLWFDDSFSQYELPERDLNSMRRSLRIMSLGENMRTSAQSAMKFKELRYLRVGGKVPHLPMKVEQLERLGMYEGPILPNGISLNKLPKSLSMIRSIPSSEITVFASEESIFTQGIQNHSLEELELINDMQLIEGLHQLSSLKILSLCRANEEEFPEQVCKLSSLIKLRIDSWARLKHLPQSFGQLKRLTRLNITRCPSLKELPSSFDELTALEHLSLEDCLELNRLPGGLKSLKYLCRSTDGNLSLDSYPSKLDFIIFERMSAIPRNKEKIRVALLVSKAALQFCS